MRYKSLILIIVVSFPIMLLGQNKLTRDELINKIEVLENEIKTKAELLEKYKTQYSELIVIQKLDSLKSQLGQNILQSKLIIEGKLRDEPDMLGNLICKIPSGESVYLTNYVDRHWAVDYNGKTGFLNKMYLKETEEMKNIREGFEFQQELKKSKEDSILAVKREARLNLETEQREKKIVDRRNEILNKYGKFDGNRILEHKIWIGMTKEQARLSWGSPKEINRTVTAYSTTEQWVYSNAYLYFDDGILRSWQD